MIDSGSSLSFINDKTVKAFKLHVEPCKRNVDLFSSNLKGEILGRFVVDIVIENETYQQVSVGIMKNFVLICYWEVIFKARTNEFSFNTTVLKQICLSRRLTT